MTYLERLRRSLEGTPGIESLDAGSVQNLRFVTAKATVEPVFPADLTVKDQAHLAAIEDILQARSPVTEEGMPVMMRLSAWIAHGGPANANGDAFVGEDLESVVKAGLFTPPYVGMVDFNHDFFPYGIWFSSSYEMDPKAGQMGILAEGTLFAWRFPEMADKLLAEQARNGFVAVSMACIAKHIETRYNAATGRTESVLREPIFLTASFLDVAPADPHGRGGVSESDDSTHESRVEEINSALLSLFAARADESASATTQEDEMDLEQIIEALKSAMGEAAGEYVSEIKEALVDAAKVPVLEARVVELEAELETVKAEKDAVSVALEAKVTALEAATAELAEATAQLETVTAERDEFLAAKAVEEATRIREARLAQLPQAYRTALEARDEETRERIIGRLVKLTDEDFAEEVNTLNESLPGKTSMADLSREQGILPSFVGNPIGGAYAIDKYVD